MFARRTLGLMNTRALRANPVLFRAGISTVKSTFNEEDEILKKQRINRPLSPELAIYQPQVTWVLSGLHRVTGVFLAAGFYGITCTYAASAIFGFHFDSSMILEPFNNLPTWAQYGIKGTIAYPFAFHAFNGVRHLVWDLGKELTLKGIYRSAYIMMGSAAVLGSYLTFLA